MNRLMDLSIITVTHNSEHVVARLIESAHKHSIILVDNASADDTVSIAKKLGANVIVNEKNFGFGNAMNYGSKAASSEWILLANPDLTFEPGCIEKLYRSTKLYPDAAILAPKILEPSGRVFFPHTSYLTKRHEWPNPILTDQNQRVPFVSGACMLVQRDVFLQLQGFDENIFLFFEDDDFCRRVCDAGYSIMWIHDATVHHLRGRSSKPSLRLVYKSRFHQSWSRLYVSKKWNIKNLIWPNILLAALKLLAAALMARKDRIARYAGTIAGYIAFKLGQPAIKDR